MVFRQLGLAFRNVFALEVQPIRHTFFLQVVDPELEVRVNRRIKPERFELLRKRSLIEFEMRGLDALVPPEFSDRQGGGMARHETPSLGKEIVSTRDNVVQMVVDLRQEGFFFREEFLIRQQCGDVLVEAGVGMDKFLHLSLDRRLLGIDAEEVFLNFVEEAELAVFQREKIEAGEFGRGIREFRNEEGIFPKVLGL